MNSQTKLSYADARTACTNAGGRLTSVLDQAEQDFLVGESYIWQNDTGVNGKC